MAGAGGNAVSKPRDHLLRTAAWAHPCTELREIQLQTVGVWELLISKLDPKEFVAKASLNSSWNK